MGIGAILLLLLLIGGPVLANANKNNRRRNTNEGGAFLGLLAFALVCLLIAKIGGMI